MKYSKLKAKKNRKEEIELKSELHKLTKQTIDFPTDENLNKLEIVKQKN